ncbi:hypothetical protein XELAEV_18044140mg [Xenopus laevis]|uniref:Ig-like domain-containing protein n=1 Tax=Xenopus laevis TaxID=8355 RepID=A0A974BYY4_XENLA|nr:hypothetical protein XELAEV_18044140mg [Xenopus laevis]
MLPPILRLFITVQLATALSYATEVTWIAQTPYEVLVKKGDAITFRCTAKDGVNLTKVSLYNHSRPLLYWTEDGYDYDQQKIDISGTYKDFNITIKNVQTEDEDIYYCWGVMMSEGKKNDVHGKGTLICISYEGSSASHEILIEIIVAALCVLYCFKTLGTCT